VKFRFRKPVRAVIRGCGVNQNALRYAVGEARRLMAEFVPLDTGRLAESALEIVENGRGRIDYTAPYAHFCYYGEGLRFKREKNPRAGAFWDRAMMQVYKDELYTRVEKFIKRN
jgi:hypothetical protein